MLNPNSRLFEGIIGTLALASAVLIWPFWRDLSDAPKLFLLSIALPGLCLALRATPSIYGFAIVAYAALSALWAPFFPDYIAGLWLLTLFACGLSLGSYVELDKMLPWLCFGIAVNGAVAFGQWSIGAFSELQAIETQYSGLLVNKNFMGELAAFGFIWAAWNKKMLWAVLCAPALAFSTSLEALLAILAATAYSFFPRVFLPAGLILGVALSWWNIESLLVRTSVWLDAAKGFSLWGHGIGQFYALLPFYSSAMIDLRHYHAHNLLVEMGFELGVAGLLFVVIVGCIAWGRATGVQRPLLIVLGVESFVGFPLHNASTLLIGSILLGSALRPRSSVCFDRSAGELSLQQWASLRFARGIGFCRDALSNESRN